MIFRVKRGTHYRDGKCYRKGDSIVTPLDLVAMFGEQRFERDYAAEQKTGGVVTKSKPKIPPPVDKGNDEVEEVEDEAKSEPLSIHGEDVTLDFPTADKIDVLVFEK